jgi:DMSO/TMAO reductase YedYZ molybdopterin-dependent catalytic subunit
MEPSDRIIKAKQTLAQRGRGDHAREVEDGAFDERLPPGQHLVSNWPVLDLGVKPAITLSEWTLIVDGCVAQPVTWTWEDFQAQPSLRSVSDFHCVTSWSKFDMEWKGVSFSHLLSVVRPLSLAKFVLFESYDDYTTNLPLEACTDEAVLLAHTWNGQPLTKEHGGPVRMIVPKRYAWKGAKWVKKITFSDRDQKGFWEVRGYSNSALPGENDRYA